jgi:hypothetical protein
LLPFRPKQAIWLGLISVAVSYAVMAGWQIRQDEYNLISKTGALLGGLSSTVVLVLTVIIGLISGGLAGWLGNALGRELNIIGRKSAG